GTIRIAAFQSAMHALIPGALSILAEEHPELRVEVSGQEPAHGLQAVLARAVDLAIAEQYPGRARRPRMDRDQVHLVSDAVSLARAPGSPVSPDAAEAPRATRDTPWVLEPEGTVTREWAE